MNQKSHIVKNADVRPARPDGTCFYCSIPLGEEHKIGCVCRRKSVLVEYKIQLVKYYPEDWEEDNINSHLQDSSWCASNAVDELVKINEEKGCMCNQFFGMYIREATQEDEKTFGVVNE